MTDNWLERTELLLGAEKLEKLRAAHVLVVGLGGVGAYAAEMIVRAGVGRMTVADADTVNPTNINRQLVALHSTVGRPKAEVLAERLRDINPTLELHVVDKYIKDEETDLLLDSARFDYAVDAIDTLSPKLALIKGCLDRGIPLHITRFFPCYKMLNAEPTPVETIYSFANEARNYLDFVTCGNC